MDPKRKRLYIILIIGCIVVSVGVFLWGRGGGPAVPSASTPDPLLTSVPATISAAPIINVDGTYSAPAVFPDNKTFDITVLDSSAFTILQPYQPATISPGELGRDDPFKIY